MAISLTTVEMYNEIINGLHKITTKKNGLPGTYSAKQMHLVSLTLLSQVSTRHLTLATC